MKLRRTLLLAVAASSGLALALTGCQSTDSGTPADGGDVDQSIVSEAQAEVTKAMADVTSGVPTESPALAEDKFIILIPCAQAGEGCAQPAEGAKEAAEAAGWRAQIIDGQGTAAGQSAAVNQAISLNPDGIITFAIDPEGIKGALDTARSAGIKVVSSSGVENDLVDFGGNPTEQAWYDSGVMLANYVIAETEGTAKSIVLTGNEFSALIPRSDGYQERLADCESCEVVATENFAFADMATSLPRLVQQLVQREADVNSIYIVYDAAVPFVLQGLESIGRDDIIVVSGDGTSDALECLRTSCGQSASAALPLGWLGWSDIDAMNRLFADADPKPAAEALPIKLITSDNVQSEPGTWNGDLDFKAAYRTLWGR